MIYFIVNRTAKTGKSAAVWKQIKQYMTQSGVSYKAFETKYKGHATQLAERISSLPDNDIRLVVVGGDGTINEAVNGIKDFESVRFAIVPSGSGNDFARGLGLEDDVEHILNQVIDADEEQDRRIDLGVVSFDDCEKARYFTISSGFGMDAIVCKKALTSKLKTVLNKLHLGSLTYLLITIQTLLSMHTTACKMVIDGKEVCSYDRLIFSAAMNMRAEGGGVPMSPDACFDDGFLNLCTAHGISKYLTFFALPFLMLEKHHKLKCFDFKCFRQCDIELSDKMVLHADGEYLGDVTRVHFECMKDKLRMIMI